MTRRTHSRTPPSGARTAPRTAAVAALALVVCGFGSAFAQPTGGEAPGPRERLVAEGATPEERAAAAEELIRLPLADTVLPEELLSPANPAVAGAVLAAVSRDVQPLAHWFGPIAALARGDSALAGEAIAALGSFRHREAAAVLVEIVVDSRPAALREAASGALLRLSGRVAAPAGGWGDWLAQALTLTERQWEQLLLRNHVERVRAFGAEASERDRQLAEAYRQVHLLTPQEQRSELLARLLRSESPVVRGLGFELVDREIGENRQLQPVVAAAAIGLLGASDSGVRARAALLLDRLAPPDAGPVVVAALERESDPRTADALLRAASRWPGPGLVKPTLRWLGEPAVRVRAVAMAWALLRDGHLEDPPDRSAVLAGVRAIETGQLTAPACRILATLGEASDVARLHVLLEDAEPTKRAMAAEALGLRADQTEALLAAATGDATLFEATARAVRSHLHDARGYSALARLPAPSPQVRARVLADFAALLPTEELIRLARLASQPAEALHLLRPLTAPERVPPEGEAEARGRYAEGLLLLVRTAMALNSPTDALNALSLIPSDTAPAEPAALVDLRVTLLLWLNRLDEAGELGGSAGAWLDALDRVVTEPHGAVIADGIEARFPQMTAEETSRLEALQQRLAEATEPAPPTEGG